MLEEFIIPFLQKNISMQIEAGAETVMIFDSSAHQLVDDDFSSYLDIFDSKLWNFVWNGSTWLDNGLILKQDGAIWLRIISKPLLTQQGL